MEDSHVASGVAVGAMLFIELIIFLAIYLYTSYCLMVIGKKTGHGDAWMAWVPIVNLYYMTVIAEKPGWWTLLMLIPCVNIVIGVILWMAIAEKRGKPNWWGILIIIPCVNLVVPGYLAFSD